MKFFEVLVQLGHGRNIASVAQLVKDTVGAESYGRCGIAVAYATVAGVRKAMEVLDSTSVLADSRWLLGLDDYLTQPQAIDLIRKEFPAAEVRLAGIRVTGKRFHPKIYWFSSKNKSVGSSLVVGSANLSNAGWCANVEAVTAVRAAEGPESEKLDFVWSQAWGSGVPFSDAILDAYRQDYVRYRPAFSSPPKTNGKLVLQQDDASIDPTLAGKCWIELGNITGFNSNQLEIKAEQALFFGLNKKHGAAVAVSVRLTSDLVVGISVRYHKNAMWRFELPKSIPEVHKGLRPNGGRSPYVAIFTKLPNGDIRLEFIRSGSRMFAAVRKETIMAGTLGKTVAREYGWI